ncbi:DNA repair protein XRCC2 homolog isoform X2 [Physcomitrium patens]|uniref:RecA family profile 1 domain-containing protein n=1 Tax=Physcomitrium patens TaxID=3218 RepID=A0A2K1L724_PHYPA|nr:DNA repair protein XRCC2 homolog isoform X2 [Physcomitrium patens]PNR61839.1 hypothetical protein PHYPA_000263 [Physcomitrium patens]|eukprot:XP_024369163.1 DNA repair protein XRCC2 homolog isoform X2 [Physcomitrella patens]
MEVEEWVMGHETAQNMLRRIGPRTTGLAPLVPALQRIVNLHGRHVVEVAGASGSAKSEFLLQAAVKCLLPKQGYDGWDGGVLWFDLDGHFDVLRLVRLLQAHIHQEARRRYEEGNEEEDEMEDGEQVLETCMERFFYTRCYSSLEFISALKSSRNHLLRAQTCGKGFRILVIDSIAAFYWLDRSAPFKGGAGNPSLSLQGAMQAVVRELKELRKLSQPTGLLVMASKCNIYSSNFSDTNDWASGLRKDNRQVDSAHEKDSRRSGLQQREFMPAVWQEFITHRLLLQSKVDGTETLFSAEWLRPALLNVDEFTINDTGFMLTNR